MSLRLRQFYSDFVLLWLKNPIVERFARVMAYPLFAYERHQEEKEEQKRRNGYEDPRFIWIKDYKNKYAGKRCFVIGCGPSLTIEDLDAIKDEYSFGSNSTILAFDQTAWRPTFYTINDRFAYEGLKEDIARYPELEVLVSSYITKYFNVLENCKIYPARLFDVKKYARDSGKTGKVVFYDDPYLAVYSACSVVFPILQFAVYMGFKEIYLLGCDCNYAQDKQHFIEPKHKNPIHPNEGIRLIDAHGKFKEFADSHGVKVINCTRGGMLEVYPRMPLEEVLASPKP